MSGDSSRHFDAPTPASTLGSALAVLRANGGIVGALIVATAILEMVAAATLYAGAIGSRAVDASIGSISFLVAVDREASQADADALGPLIRATRGIAEARFRSKDDGIKALVARGLPTPEGRNPLPDVWVAKMSAAAVANGSVAAAVADTQRALAALPRVDSATTDDAWVRSTDRSVARWRSATPVAGALILGLAASMLASIGYLAGCGLASGPKRALTGQVLALVLIVTAIVGAFIAFLAGSILAQRWNDAVTETLQAPWGQVLADNGASALAVAAVSMLILAGGLIVGSRRAE